MGLSEKGRTYGLFAVVVIACALGGLSQTAVNSMIEGIGVDFGIGESVTQWLTTIYMLVLGVTVPSVTFLSRKLPMRVLVLLAIAFCFVGSVIAFVAPNFIVLVVGRVLQAISTGITMPLSQTIAMVRFPKTQNASAMGISGIAFGFAPNIGPTIGGVLVDTLGWHSFFAILAACCVALIVAALLIIERDAAPGGGTRLDVISLALSTLGFGGLLLAFSNAANFPLVNPLVWAPAIVGAVCIMLFVVRQKRVKVPLVSMKIFASKQYTIGFLSLNFLFGSFLGVTLLIPLYVMSLCGGTALDAGMVFLPALVPALLCNPLGGILSDKIGIRPIVLFGSVGLILGSVSMAFVDESTPFALVAAMQFVRACGVSTLIGPLASWSLAQLVGPIVMDGSAFSVAVRQVCGSLGTAIMVLIITAVGTLGVSAALPYQLAFGFSAVLGVATAVLCIAKIR